MNYIDRYDDEEYGTVTLYFSASIKEDVYGLEFSLDDKGFMISVEFEDESLDPYYAQVCVSPVNEHGIAYNWMDIDTDYDFVSELVNIYRKPVNMYEKHVNEQLPYRERVATAFLNAIRKENICY